MASPPLSLVEKNAGLTIESGLPLVLSRKVSHEQAALFATLYRRIAVSRLLLSGTPEDFFDFLSQGARAFLFFLEGADDRSKVTSLSDPFFDAVAAGDDDAARAIAARSRGTFHEGEEYEEDFFYPWLLMNRFFLVPAREPPGVTLERWAALASGVAEPRLDLCSALLAADQAAFDSALHAFVSAMADEARERVEDGRMPADDVPTLARVSVELLAILRMAGLAGLETEHQYPLAPSVARRLDLRRPGDPEAWRRLPSYREIS